MKGEKMKGEKSGKGESILIDATDCIVGRLASFVAKQALLGKNVVIVNSEKAVISGKKHNILKKYLRRRALGKGRLKGPYWPKEADRLLRRIIRGMLPWKKTRGREAFKRIKCYKGNPLGEEEKEKFVTIDVKEAKKELLDFITLSQLENLLKGKSDKIQ
jgi:large subunit ribosomal protein L13